MIRQTPHRPPGPSDTHPSGRWKGLHGFDGTMAAEGTVKPHRKAYECAVGANQVFNVSPDSV